MEIEQAIRIGTLDALLDAFFKRSHVVLRSPKVASAKLPDESDFARKQQ